MPNSLNHFKFSLLALIVATTISVGCSRKDETPQDCVPAEPSAAAPTEKRVIERTRLRRDKFDRETTNWCRACVLSAAGFASCQRVWAEDEKEDIETLRRKARDKACTDVGFTPESCPDKSVLGVLCKDEPIPENVEKTATALRQVYFGKRGEATTDTSGDDAATSEKEAPASSTPPPAPATATE